MANQPFAFDVALPMHGGGAPAHHYDAEAQQTVWEGDSPPLAASCSTKCCSIGCQNPSCWVATECNAYGDYCNTWDYKWVWVGVQCDV